VVAEGVRWASPDEGRQALARAGKGAYYPRRTMRSYSRGDRIGATRSSENAPQAKFRERSFHALGRIGRLAGS
jgi:hypothetical protein